MLAVQSKSTDVIASRMSGDLFFGRDTAAIDIEATTTMSSDVFGYGTFRWHSEQEGDLDRWAWGQDEDRVSKLQAFVAEFEGFRVMVV
jgi:hypothetical protein